MAHSSSITTLPLSLLLQIAKGIRNYEPWEKKTHTHTRAGPTPQSPFQLRLWKIFHFHTDHPLILPLYIYLTRLSFSCKTLTSLSVSYICFASQMMATLSQLSLLLFLLFFTTAFYFAGSLSPKFSIIPLLLFFFPPWISTNIFEFQWSET